METNNNQVSQAMAQYGAVDYAAALRQYNKYGRGRSMKKFCEDEGYDYWKFCKLAREGQKEIRIRFNNDLMMSRRGGDLEEMIDVIRKIQR